MYSVHPRCLYGRDLCLCTRCVLGAFTESSIVLTQCILGAFTEQI